MKMNLDDTWKKCLSMWRCIAKEVRGGNKNSILSIKDTWLNNHGFAGKPVAGSCLFCEYAESHSEWRYPGYCKRCPGKKVNSAFDCQNRLYDFDHEPIKFYNKLVSLNRKRLKAKK